MIPLKAAILLQFIRLLVPGGTRNPFFWMTHMTLCFHVMFYVAGILVEIFQCHPMERAWNIFIEGTCIDVDAMHTSAGAVNLVSDLIIFVLPQRIIWGLQMSLKKKMGVSVIFAVGILSILPLPSDRDDCLLTFGSELV